MPQCPSHSQRPERMVHAQPRETLQCQSNDTNDARNGIRLRADLHHGLDNYVFVPYPSGDRFVVVFLKYIIGYAES